MTDYLALDEDTSLGAVSGRAFHKVFEAEKRDVSWAESVEPRMREYFAKQRRAPAFAIVGLGCRSTMCEVLAVARDPKAAPADVETWQDAVSAIAREPWYARAQIRREHVEFGQTRDGRIAILTYWLRTD